jgi:hypothetical protein
MVLAASASQFVLKLSEMLVVGITYHLFLVPLADRGTGAHGWEPYI